MHKIVKIVLVVVGVLGAILWFYFLVQICLQEATKWVYELYVHHHLFTVGDCSCGQFVVDAKEFVRQSTGA